MITKTTIIAISAAITAGGTGFAFTPQNPIDEMAISAGPVAVTVGGETAVAVSGAEQLDPTMTLTLKNGRQFSLTF